MNVANLRIALIVALAGIAMPGLPAQQPDTTQPAQPQPAAQGTPSQPAAQVAPTAPVAPASQAAPGAPSSPAQAPNPAQPVRNADGTFTIHMTTRLVVLDTVVLDAKGAVV
jgi:glucose/arabinose dehydrogenase